MINLNSLTKRQDTPNHWPKEALGRTAHRQKLGLGGSLELQLLLVHSFNHGH